jgi:hypothetical protein
MFASVLVKCMLTPECGDRRELALGIPVERETFSAYYIYMTSYIICQVSTRKKFRSHCLKSRKNVFVL